MIAAPAPSPPSQPSPVGPLRLAALLVRFRLRTLWNGARARGRGRFPTLIVLVGLLTSVAYVGLFSQAFASIVASTSFAGQLAALALVTGTIAFGSLTAKAASSEAVLAGSGENEFLLARPVALSTLVAARCLAESVTDPFGALFLFPVLLAAALTWHLPPGAWAVAALSSMATQIIISALAQAAQIAVVRLVPRARRRGAWMALRLVASLSLAALWMMGTWVLRLPAEIGPALARLAPLAAVTPAALIVAPLAAVARGGPGSVALALGGLAVAAAAAVGLAATVARRAGARGWEEAGAPWAEAGARPGPARAAHRPLTAATKDLRLITRDRAQLLALLAMPVIFVGVQLFGAAGWTWSTASLQRVAYLAFSLTLYMATIGPLAHMQAERRAFWIMRTVPVSVGRLLAAKARAWSLLIGGTAALAFAGLSLGAPIPSAWAWLSMALLVVAGAVGMTWLAIGLAGRAADLSDDQRPAIGPATIYAFLLVGGLYNVVLGGDGATRLRGVALYLFTLAATWMAGVEQAGLCLDPEAARTRRLTLADGATMVVVYALGQHGAAAAARMARADLGHGLEGTLAAAVARLGVIVAVGGAALVYLARRPRARARSGPLASAVLAIAAGALVALGLRALGFPDGATAALARRPAAAAAAALLVLGEELVFRGVVQRAVEELLQTRPAWARWARPAAAGVSLVVGLVAVGEAPELALGALVALHAVAAVTRAVTGRTSAAWLARVVALAAASALAIASTAS